MLAYNLYKFKEQAVFLNQETRQFDHKLNSGDFGLCFGNMNRWQVNLLVGVGTASFVSMYYFKNGERDMNKYSALNGVYSSSCFSYRTELTVKLLKHLKVVASYGGLSGSEYTDKSYLKGIDSNGAYENVFFPADYNLFQSTTLSGQSFDYDLSKIAKAKFATFSLGLQYSLKLF